MRHDRGVFETRNLETEAAQVERSRADASAGRIHSHAVVSGWLATFGDPDFKPFHEWLAEQNG